MRLMRFILPVIGGVAAVTGVLIALAGGLLLWAERSETDRDGFFTSSVARFATSAYAIRSDDFDVGGDAPEWIVGDRPATIRVRARSAAGKPIFIGVARKADVDRYLGGVAHEVVEHLDQDPLRPEYRREPGDRAPAPPTAQGFWGARVDGARPGPFTWDVEGGRWAVVAMNADGSPGIALDADVGAKVGILLGLSIGLLAGGVVLLVLGLLLIRVVRRRPPAPPAAPPSVDEFA
jgi:hypothetical protein